MHTLIIYKARPPEQTLSATYQRERDRERERLGERESGRERDVFGRDLWSNDCPHMFPPLS